MSGTRAVFVFLCLAYFAQPNVLEICPRCSRLPFLFEAKWYSIVHADHILCVHAPADGLLGSSRLTAVVNNGALNMGVQGSLQKPAF